MLRSHLQALLVAASLLIPSLAISSGACLTGTCHSAVLSVKRPHTPVAGGECLACHKQQSAKHPTPGQKGFSLIASGGALCSPCHEQMGKKKNVHQPVKEGGCLSCHKPHGSDNPSLLTVGEDRSKLCFDCHDAAPFVRQFKHGPVAAGSCDACHDPHESDEKSLLNGPLREVCLKCHTDFDQGMKEATSVHGPVRVSPCTSCHDAHGSDNSSLLLVTSPELCFQCHKTLQAKLSDNSRPHKPVVQKGGCSTCHASHYSKGKRLLQSGEKELCLQCHGDNKLAPLKNIKEQHSTLEEPTSG